MKKYLVVLSFGAVFAWDVEAANFSCRRPEYAELKDMTKKELTELYCENDLHINSNERLRDKSFETAHKMMNLGASADSSSYMTQAEQYGNDSVTCAEINADISRMIKKRFQSKTPICPKPSSAQSRAIAKTVFLCEGPDGNKELTEEPKTGFKCNKMEVK